MAGQGTPCRNALSAMRIAHTPRVRRPSAGAADPVSPSSRGTFTAARDGVSL